MHAQQIYDNDTPVTITEKDMEKCDDDFTKKCYSIIKEIYGLRFALLEIQHAPYFRDKKI